MASAPSVGHESPLCFCSQNHVQMWLLNVFGLEFSNSTLNILPLLFLSPALCPLPTAKSSFGNIKLLMFLLCFLQSQMSPPPQVTSVLGRQDRPFLSIVCCLSSAHPRICLSEMSSLQLLKHSVPISRVSVLITFFYTFN